MDCLVDWSGKNGWVAPCAFGCRWVGGRGGVVSSFPSRGIEGEQFVTSLARIFKAWRGIAFNKHEIKATPKRDLAWEFACNSEYIREFRTKIETRCIVGVPGCVEALTFAIKSRESAKIGKSESHIGPVVWWEVRYVDVLERFPRIYWSTLERENAIETEVNGLSS